MSALTTNPRGLAVPASARLSQVSFILALVYLAVLLAWVVIPGLFAAHDPVEGITADKFASPGLAYPLGADHLGRDIFSRVVFGARSSLSSALLSVVIGLGVGSALGLASGYIGGVIDSVVGRIVDVLLAVPGFLLSLVIVSVLGFATVNAAVAVGISSIALFARLVRSEVLRIKNLDFVESSRIVGTSDLQIVFRHIVPNGIASVLSTAVLAFGSAIIGISALAFLGYGNPPPSPDWGLLVAEGATYVTRAPWLVWAPGVVIILTVLALNRVATSIRRRL